MPKVVVAEKPSVARDIARVLKAGKKGEGCLSGNGYIVTWALGHLVHLAEPDDYGPPWSERWSLGQLPMIPQQWKLKTHKSTAAQFSIVKKLITAAETDEIICATDAGREGEHIFRLIYQHARCRKPFKRLWISSLTDAAIGQGLRNLQNGSAFDDLAQAARARAQADWLIGLNLTRAYTVHNKVLCTIGRVQTPTLAMIVKRDETIANFKKVFFYELVAQLREGFLAKYTDEEGQTRIDSKERAEQLHQRLSPNKTGTVLKVEKKVKKNRPPPLFDLITLQREANRRFGFTAAKVLEYAQALYETHKLITYPRTESRHISEDMVPQLPGILEKLKHPQAPLALERLRQGHKLGKAYVDKSKLSDHHGIIPTGGAVSPTLPPPLRKVYDLVVERFVAIFLPEQVVEETAVHLDIGKALFVGKGSEVLEAGWTVVNPRVAANDGEEDERRQTIPPLREGQQVNVEAMEVVEKETKPPKPYTDATLLTAMKNAGREVDDEALAAAMKESGLGTPATRAEIIERLIRSEFVQRNKKSLAATEKGKTLVAVVAESLKSPELTGQWEQKLKDVEEGQLSGEAFHQSIIAFVESLVPQVAQSPTLPPSTFGGNGRGKKSGGGAAAGVSPGTCPKCKQGEILENKKGFGCNRYREGCDFVIWKTVARKKLTKKQVGDLLARGQTGEIKGFTSKAGKKFAARLKMSGDFKVEFDFDSTPGAAAKSPSVDKQRSLVSAPEEPGVVPAGGAPIPMATAPTGSTGRNKASATTAAEPVPSSAKEQSLTCPKCGQGQIIEGRRGFGCNRFREGCDFVVWKGFAGKKLTQKQIETLIEKGVTRAIKGFKNESGESFQGRLKLTPDWQVMLEP